ncbi:hypothetical protein [Proteiniborus sp. MB09-C3]|uniref:hypothetical protein n=1 Tax=Proteiniborus sp. MB09-C3 TaxID=3050072 RepID=UPI0025534412|nr:hypothetical protein [Proteiniborus sp. MB09-C3]WIV10531.1 hypothetical protein QO263_10200 [Proteiniborus sp. MB09-C3]
MATVKTWKELEKAMRDQYEKEIKKRFKNGEVKEHCSVCKCEQVLKLEDNKVKCTVCDNEFDLDIEYKFKQ